MIFCLIQKLKELNLKPILLNLVFLLNDIYILQFYTLYNYLLLMIISYNQIQ